MTLTAFLAIVMAVVMPMAAMPSRAAPIDGKDLQSPAAGGVPGIDPATALPPTSGSDGSASSTVELLLQMQNQPAAAVAPDRRTATPRSSSPAGAQPAREVASSPLPELGPGLLEARSPLGGGAGSSRDDGTDPMPRAEGFSGYSGPRGGSAAARNDEGGLLANPVIRFIRDHRELAIGGSLGLLVAVWLTANYRGRSHRRR